MIRLTSPTKSARVMSGWGRPRAYRNGIHEGLDFPDGIGSPILAAASGEVVRVDNTDNSFAGKWIAIHHGGGIHTRYLHNKQNLVSKGDRVSRGQTIATLGQTGTSGKGKPHLHFDVKLLDSTHSKYVAKYGTPTTGWFGSSSIGTGVPAETFMSGVNYDPSAKKWALDRGVVFYKGISPLVLLGIAGAATLVYLAKK